MNSQNSAEDTLYDAARRLADPAARAAFLNAACAGNSTLRERLEKLLHAAPEADDFFSRNAVDLNRLPPLSAEMPTLITPPAEQPGEMIGRYKLLQQIGEGGFGTVWMAEQMEPVSRRVALKIIKLGMDTREVIARFEAERQALAMMDHPNIAKVLDAGATDKGRPFFVMELVKGMPITQYCDEAGLGTRERLALFGDVCSAINHAHQKGIIHRDIKPSNVMVTQHGDKPVVKVIDFGIAKATQGKLTDKTLFTRFEQFIGTPVYMSPEQASTSGLDIDTRSDIYALGILLYELLTGKPPFDAKSLASAGYEEMRRIIREVEPVKPSSRLSTMAGEERTLLAKSRHIEPAKVGRLVEPDLDWIVMKAIEKDRARRYETANAFAQDIAHFLADEPVSASPPGAGLQFRKFARRHKAGLRVAAAIAAVLVAATLVSTWQAVRATQAEKKTADTLVQVEAERDAKDLARKEAEDIAKFLGEVFQSPDPARDGRTITVAETLDTAAKKLETDLAAQPAQRTKLQATLASTYDALGLTPQAIPLQEKVRDFHRAAMGAEHPHTLTAMGNLAISYYKADHRDEALKMFEEVSTLRRKVNGPEHPDTIVARGNLAMSYFHAGRRGEALKLLEEVLLLCRKVVNGPEDRGTLVKMNNLATFYLYDGRREEALKIQEEVLRLSRKVNGPEHPDTLTAMTNLAVSYHNVGRRDEALKLKEEVLPLSCKVLGPEHPETLTTMNNLALSYHDAVRHDEALKLFGEVLFLRRKVIGPEHRDTLLAMHNLAHHYFGVGRRDEALKLQEEVLPLSRKVNGPGHPGTIMAMGNLALTLADFNDRRDEALKLREEVLPLSRKVLGPEHPDTIRAMGNLAHSYFDASRRDEALKIHKEALPLSRKVNGPEHPATLLAMTNLATSLGAAGRLDEAIALQEQSLAIIRRVLPPKHTDRMFAQGNLADLYVRADRKDEAIALRKELAALRTNPLPPVVATLVPPDSEWKWLHPTGGVDPAGGDADFHNTFFTSGYDDSAWKSGKDSADFSGGFGYGRDFTGLDIGLPPDETQRHAAYFRHRFTTDKPHASLELRCQRDDALILYLDGTEVLRDNLPAGPDAYKLSALKTQWPENDGVIHRFPIPGTLAPGEHLLAISLHNAIPPSSDLRIGGITLVETGAEAKPPPQDSGEKTTAPALPR